MMQGQVLLIALMLCGTAFGQASQSASQPTTRTIFNVPGARPAGSPTSQGVLRANAPTSQPADVNKWTQCYLGESVVTREDGAPVGTMVVAIRRDFSKVESTITETMLVVHPLNATREEITVYKVDGNKVTSLPGGKWSVEGELEGPAWAWTGMKYLFKLNDATGSVRGEEQIADGVLRDKRQFLTPRGAVRVNLSDTLHAISPESFATLRMRLNIVPAAPASAPASRPVLAPASQSTH